MRRLRTVVSLALAFLLLASNGVAQKGSWDAVENLRPGTPISVLPEHGHRFRCEFREANDDQLVCDVIQRLGPCLLCQLAPGLSREDLYRSVVFQRRDVAQVHWEHRGASTAIGAAVGLGVGIGLGSRNHSPSRPISLGLGAGLFGFIGGAVGRNFPIVHGTAVYEK